MEKCQRCKIKYPDGYLAPMMTSNGSIIVCGICALDISNRIHEINEKKFSGEIAEEMRLMAIKYRKNSLINKEQRSAIIN